MAEIPGGGNTKGTAPRALDLFCGAGGASMGLHRAGFEVVGVDISPQPNYPFEFHQMDALETNPWDFDFVWASPPCQHSTAYKRRPGHVRPVDNLIAPTREILCGCKAYVIENVEGARESLRKPVTLCGSMFGLDVRRHRLFETNFPLPKVVCNHGVQFPRFAPATNRKNLRRTVEVGVWRIPLDVQQKAMGIDWMMLEELSAAIPPAYSEFIGRAAFAALEGK